MIQLKILSGKQAGSTSVARRFPFRIGRAPESGLVLEEPGVWQQHLEIEFEPGNGFVANATGEALITVNGEPGQRVLLRNGDRIELGGGCVQFWLGETRQHGFRGRDALVWAGIALVTAAQIFLITRLLH